eukprot:2983448-Pyramimonas_sp.AAC.1
MEPVAFALMAMLAAYAGATPHWPILAAAPLVGHALAADAGPTLKRTSLIPAVLLAAGRARSGALVP